MTFPPQHMSQQPLNQSANCSLPLNNFASNPGYDLNVRNQAGVAADIGVVYGATPQAPLLTMQQPMFNGYNPMQQISPGVLINSLNQQEQQPMHQGQVYPPSSSQIGLFSGYPSMGGLPIVFGRVAPATLPTCIPPQQHHPFQDPSHQKRNQGSMNHTLPHQLAERDESSQNRTFQGFSGDRRALNVSSGNRHSKSHSRPKRSQTSSHSNSREERGSHLPEISENARRTCNMTYRHNKNLVASGSTIPMSVTRHDDGLSHLINGLTKDVIRLQQVVQMLVNERDAAVASKASQHRDSSSQTFLLETKEKETQVGSGIDNSVKESKIGDNRVESPTLARLAIPPESTKKSPETAKQLQEEVDVPVNPSGGTSIAEKVSDLQLSPTTINTEESSAELKDEKPLVSVQAVGASSIVTGMELYSKNLPSFVGYVSVETSDSPVDLQKEASISETSMIEKAEHFDTDSALLLVTTTISTAESPNKLLGIDNKSDETCEDKKKKAIGAEERECRDEKDARQMDMSLKENGSVVEENKKADRQKSHRRANYADIAKLHLPISPATQSQPMNHQAVHSLSHPLAICTPTALVHKAELPDGFQYPKNPVPSPSLTNDELQKAFTNQRLFDSPVITLVRKPQECTEATPSKKDQPPSLRKKAKKVAPTPKKTNESAQDFDEFVSDEKAILEFTAVIKRHLSDYAARMRDYRNYNSYWNKSRPKLVGIIETLVDYWLINRTKSDTSEELDRAANNLKCRMDSLEAKKDLSSQKLTVFIQSVLDTGDSLLSDDLFYALLLDDKTQQLANLCEYMQMLLDYPSWAHLLDLPPSRPSAKK